MKTLTSPVSTSAAAGQSGWVELYEFYLSASIVTPWGTTNIIRLCTTPDGFAFFAPNDAPEPGATRGTAQTYQYWPLKRDVVKGDTKFQDDKLQINASNVTSQFAALLALVNWYDTPVVIRKVPLGQPGLTTNDCAVLFTGVVDSISITTATLQFTCSSSLGALNYLLPSENMHASCRFRFGDDNCTQIPWRPENRLAGTCGSGSSLTNVKAAALTQDTGSSSGYGADLVNALADAAITASSEGPVSGGVPCTVNPATDYVVFNHPTNYFMTTGLPLTFAAGTTPPAPLALFTTYYIRDATNLQCRLSLTPGGAAVNLTTAGSGLVAYLQTSVGAKGVKISNGLGWQFTNAADWGTQVQGYYQIPDAQAGLKNAALKPYIQFDFGSAVTPKLWQVSSFDWVQAEQRVRLIEFFSSPDASTWTFESYFEVPKVGGQLFDVLIPKASTARYWRICVRSRWAETLYYLMFQQVSAYTGSRNWWLDGQLTFSGNVTAALQGVSRQVLQSFSGELFCAPLPVAPASGDTFTLKRGCARTFNACCARLNTENYGGFNDLELQNMVNVLAQ